MIIMMTDGESDSGGGDGYSCDVILVTMEMLGAVVDVMVVVVVLVMAMVIWRDVGGGDGTSHDAGDGGD